jgi:hypothetical protein
VNDVIREVQEIVNARLSSGCSLDQSESARSDLSRYLRLQRDELGALADALDEACATKLVIDCPPCELDSLRDRGVGVASYMSSANEASSTFRIGGSACELRVPASWAMNCDAQDFVASVHAAAMAGCEAIQVDHLGLLPDVSLPALRQAMRFARRSVEGAVATAG